MTLIEKGANIHEKDNDGMTPLHFASQNGHTETATMLMETGADIYEKYKNGSTAIHFASQNGHTETAMMLMEKGANIHEKNNDGRTPLHFASDKGHTETAMMLIEKGSDFNSRDNSGLTPGDIASGFSCRQLFSNERELNWLKRRSYAHFLSGLNQRFDPPMTGTTPVVVFNVEDLAREIGSWI